MRQQEALFFLFADALLNSCRRCRPLPRFKDGRKKAREKERAKLFVNSGKRACVSWLCRRGVGEGGRSFSFLREWPRFARVFFCLSPFFYPFAIFRFPRKFIYWPRTKLVSSIAAQRVCLSFFAMQISHFCFLLALPCNPNLCRQPFPTAKRDNPLR